MFANQICDRCQKSAEGLMMSKFNTQMCCDACIEKERKHPLYQKASDVEIAEIRNGNYNFPGIGLPADLMEESIC